MVYLNSFIEQHTRTFQETIWAFASGQLNTDQRLTTASVQFSQLMEDVDYILKLMNDQFATVVQPYLLDPNVATPLKTMLNDFASLIDQQAAQRYA